MPRIIPFSRGRRDSTLEELAADRAGVDGSGPEALARSKSSSFDGCHSSFHFSSLAGLRSRCTIPLRGCRAFERPRQFGAKKGSAIQLGSHGAIDLTHSARAPEGARTS